MHNFVGQTVLLGLLLIAAAYPPSAKAESPWHVSGVGSVGWTSGEHSGGVTLDGMALVGLHVAEVGIAGQFATNLFGTMTAPSVVGGLAFELDFMRFGMWAECGGELYTAVGGNFLSGDPGISALVPFVGARGNISARIAEGRSQEEVWLGLTVIGAQDVDTVRGVSVYADDDGGVARVQHQAGQRRWALLVSLSVTVGLGAPN